ncbi:hypothetical protein BJ138DRAFT_1118660 [Hygrophoropsis aurantiaca]|uniref:Uncharacterized protein n=1 Tax=Hygrophoropsis aurantiaca TaxID=72124 RepID=A0ACB7ZVP2_9AGAM|nr:hypothetical protein BJ138DRAFT_1118660 [Hygrophoropsis aurantiaca]
MTRRTKNCAAVLADEDNDAAVLAAMETASSPVASPQRPVADTPGPATLGLSGSIAQCALFQSSAGSSAMGTRDLLAYTKRYATKQKLKPEQIAEAEAFDPPNECQIKLFITLQAIENRLEKIVTTAPPFTISAELKANIDTYAVAVLNSSKISSYKGEVATEHILTLLKKNRFDLPPGIECNAAQWEKVVVYTGESLTQTRSRLKKLLVASLKDKSPAESSNLFEVAQDFVAGTRSQVTIGLCARIALMRAVYLKTPGALFWDAVDARMEFICNASAGDPAKVARAFKKYLNEDRKTYSAQCEFDIGDGDSGVDAVQQEVDDTIEPMHTSHSATAEMRSETRLDTQDRRVDESNKAAGLGEDEEQ